MGDLETHRPAEGTPNKNATEARGTWRLPKVPRHVSGRTWVTLIVFVVIAFSTFNFSSLRQEIRIYVGPFPFGFADLAAALAVASVVVVAIRNRGLPVDRLTLLIVLLVAYMTLVGVTVGLLRHTPLYGVAQE